MKTLGGRQFWADARFFRGWRIQQNRFTGHYRLLDSKDNRQATGSLEKCLARLEELKQSGTFAFPAEKPSGKAAILVHGILRSSKTFALMRPALGKAGYEVVGFDYPSTQIEVGKAADYLHQVIQSLEDVDQVNFVVHSLGGLVVRAYLRTHRDPRISRMVMLGVPNRGAEMADLLRRNLAFRLVFGPAGQQLGTGEAGLSATLPIPDFEFAIVAGARGVEAGFNPLLTGDDDSLVRVESARLEGAADSMTVPVLHSFLPANAQVIEATVRFLDTSRLRREDRRDGDTA